MYRLNQQTKIYLLPEAGTKKLLWNHQNSTEKEKINNDFIYEAYHAPLALFLNSSDFTKVNTYHQWKQKINLGHYNLEWKCLLLQNPAKITVA